MAAEQALKGWWACEESKTYATRRALVARDFKFLRLLRLAAKLLSIACGGITTWLYQGGETQGLFCGWQKVVELPDVAAGDSGSLRNFAKHRACILSISIATIASSEHLA
jgi:hypothetical protein